MENDSGKIGHIMLRRSPSYTIERLVDSVPVVTKSVTQMSEASWEGQQARHQGPCPTAKKCWHAI